MFPACSNFAKKLIMETILIATDFSDASNNATEYGVQLAKFFGARIILVNAYPIPASDYETGLSVEMMNSLIEASEDGLAKLKKDICARHKRDLDIEGFADAGMPYHVIEKACRKYDPELIVMGIVGQAGKLREHLIGSTAVKVARQLDVPTLIVPEKASYHRIKKIAFACDLEKTEESAVVYIAKYFASIFDAEMEIINIERPLEELTPAKSKSTLFIEKKLENLKHRTIYATDKDVAHGLTGYLKVHPSDLVMVNPKKHNIFHSLFHESVTKELAFHLQVPLLAIH